MLEFFTDQLYTAKKTHRCQLCNQNILIGEKYHRQSGKYEGDFFDRCLHRHCNNMIAEFCQENKDNEYSTDWIWEWLVEKYCHDCGKCNGKVFKCDLIIKDFVEGENK